MKRVICLFLALMLLPTALSDSEDLSFLSLSGLDEVITALEDGTKIESISYYHNAYEEFGRDFTTNDACEIERLFNALVDVEIDAPSEIFITDWYPTVYILLNDGRALTIHFDWQMLFVNKQNYTLKNDEALWSTIGELSKAYNTEEGTELEMTAPYETVTDIVYINGSMGKIYGELTIPNTGETPKLVIMSHGFGGNHMGQNDYAEYFAQNGFATYNFDFCGGGYYSLSEGAMTKMSVLTEANDLMAIIDFFKDDESFDGIMLWGASQGGFVSTYVAAKRPNDVEALAIEYPAYVLQDDAKKVMRPDGSFPETYTALGALIGRVYGEDATSFDIYDVMANYKGKVLILHGDKDGLVPISYSERAEKTFENARLVVMKGQNHGFTGEARLEAMRLEADFLKRHSK